MSPPGRHLLLTALDAPGGGPWKVSGATFVRSFSIAAQEGFAQAVFFKPDGMKMYTDGSVNDRIYEYDLGTAWDVSTAVFLQSLHVALEDTSPVGLFFKPDGTKMYFAGNTADVIIEYNLGTPWDISTAVSAASPFSVAGQETLTTGMFLSSDGARMYVSGADTDSIHQYDVVTPWDVSTAVFVRSQSVAAQDSFPNDVFFKTDGTRMYVVGAVNATIYEYILGTAWDISTATLVGSKSVAAQDAAAGPTGLFIRDDGARMYMLGTTNDAVYEYRL